LCAGLSDLVLALAGERARRASEKPIDLSSRMFSASFGRPCSRDALFHVDHFLDLGEEPRIDLGSFRAPLVAGPEPHAWATMSSRSGVGADGAADGVLVVAFAVAGDLDLVEAGQPGFQAAQRLLQAFLEGAADGHDLADRLHRGGQVIGSAPGNFSKAKRGILVTT
jgi:hypothetical protein